MHQLLHPSNDMRKKIQDYSYGLRDIIGRGFSSVVYRGANDKTKEKVAIKVIDIRAIQGKPEKKMLEGEIQALKKLSHPNILKCHDIFSTANNCYIITEFCNEGDLENLLKKREKLAEEDALPIIREFVTGYIYIAENGFLHRDLKPANILLRDKVVKIADFGFAKKATSNPKETVNVGSPLYMSPEALQGNIYTTKNDIWSVGVILYEILHGKAPWACSNQRQLIEEINKNSIYLLKNLSEDLKDFIRKCLTPDQKKRMGLKQFSSHPFVLRMMLQAPLLLRKATSNNQNQEQVATSENEVASKPKILHHRQHNDSVTPQRQFLCHLNWMRFLNKFNLLFPDSTESSKSTIGLRFVVVKQLLGQLQALELSLKGENVFCIEGWSEYLSKKEDKHTFVRSIEQYKKNYEPYGKLLKEWIPLVSKDKKLAVVADLYLQRSEYLCMVGLSCAASECKTIWKNLQAQGISRSQGELQGRQQSEAVRLDFTMTYFQLNQFLVDGFYDSQFFTRISQLQTINQCRPAALHGSHLSDLQHKLSLLALLK